MILEYVCGGELFSHLRRAGRFSNEVTQFYAAEIITAIESLHKKNIIYRDLKPENMLLDKDGHIKICDFGFAKRVDDRFVYSSFVAWSIFFGTKKGQAPSPASSFRNDRSFFLFFLSFLHFIPLLQNMDFMRNPRILSSGNYSK